MIYNLKSVQSLKIQIMIPSIPMNRHMSNLDHYQIFAILIIFLLPSPAFSTTSTPPPPVPGYQNGYGNMKPKFGLAVLIITAFIFFLAFFSLCVRHCGNRSNSSAVSAAVPAARTRRGYNGLDPTVLQSFPTFDYSAVKEMKIGKGALECAVCLSEFQDDETLRFIPKCDHVFHAECIDEWLGSHATCPVCRANLVPVPGESFDVPVLGLGPAQPNSRNDDVLIEVETMEEPLNARARARRSLIRSRTRGMSGRRRWFGLFLRSNSTGHVEVNNSGDTERFTLRLPAEFRRQVIGGKLSRTTSCLVPVGSRVEKRAGFGGSYNEGGSQEKLGGLYSKADRWVFSVTRPFSTQQALPPV